MATAENAKIEYESGQDLVDMVALTDQGDHMDFRSADPLWSGKSGFAPNVKPNGLATGGAVIPAASGSNNMVDVAALTCYLAGVLESVPADTDVSVSRGTTSPAEPYRKTSITVTAAGAIAAVPGATGASFSTVRGADGGPPYILPGSIEIAQVWLSSAAAAAILATEIKQVVGAQCERYDYPTWTEKKFNVESGIIGNAGVLFASALPLIHSAASPVVPAAKGVYAEYYEPVFTEIPNSSDFVPPETSYSVSSKKIYQTTLAAASSSLDQGSFTAFMRDGISDGLLALKGATIFFRFYQNKLNSLPYILSQGILGVKRTFPAGDQIAASCTISPEEAAVEVTG
jgi:hypothetical protein